MLQFLWPSRKAQRTSFWAVTLKLVALPIVSSCDSIPVQESAILPSMAFYAEILLTAIKFHCKSNRKNTKFRGTSDRARKI